MLFFRWLTSMCANSLLTVPLSDFLSFFPCHIHLLSSTNHWMLTLLGLVALWTLIALMPNQINLRLLCLDWVWVGPVAH